MGAGGRTEKKIKTAFVFKKKGGGEREKSGVSLAAVAMMGKSGGLKV